MTFPANPAPLQNIFGSKVWCACRGHIRGMIPPREKGLF
jgi:hypothetical protein